MMVSMKDAILDYPNGKRAIKGVSFDVDQGEFVFLVGPSGSGKSSIIKMLTAEERPTKGEVEVCGYDIGTVRRSQIPYLRRKIGVVFQDFRIIEKKTVFENVAFAMHVMGESNKQIKKRVQYVLDLVGLHDMAKRMPNQISGGELQRVGIARALVNNPELIIADEPTGNLDPAFSIDIMMLLEKINQLGTTILVVTHEKELVNTLGKRVLSLDNGRIVSDHQGAYYAEDAEVASEVAQTVSDVAENPPEVQPDEKEDTIELPVIETPEESQTETAEYPQEAVENDTVEDSQQSAEEEIKSAEEAITPEETPVEGVKDEQETEEKTAEEGLPEA